MQTYQKYDYESKRTCTIENHKDEQILQICTYDKCDQTSRWACAECMKINLHNHNEVQQVYLNNQNQYLAFLHKKKLDLNKHKEKLNYKIQKIGSQLKELINQIYILQDKLPSLEIQQSQQQLQQIEQMINYVNQDFYLISNEQIIQTEKINNKEIVFVLQKWMKFEQNLQIIIDQFEKLNNQQKNNDKQINPNQFNYQEDPLNKIQNQQTQYQSQNGIRFINVEQIAQSQMQKIQQDQKLPQILSKHTDEQKRLSEQRGYQHLQYYPRRCNPFQNNLQSPNQIFTVNYKNQQPCLPKK